MRRAKLELAVGVFVLLGMACLAYLAINLGKMEIFGEGYQIFAVFDNVSGLKTGAAVEVAGVEVGQVNSIQLTPLCQARVGLKLRQGVKIHDDAIASVRTKGIIGDKFVKVSPGSSEKIIPVGGKILNTESGIDLEELIGSYIHGKV
ncbi:MAG: outer membrane lipid asymmetry maintenance protein MlaD [Thermodesulfobacteriota bacterium]